MQGLNAQCFAHINSIVKWEGSGSKARTCSCHACNGPFPQVVVGTSMNDALNTYVYGMYCSAMYCIIVYTHLVLAMGQL